MDSAIVMIALSEIKGKRLMYKGRTLTSEMVKEGINSELSKMGCAASHTIVACGIHSSMPHHEGEGALRAGRMYDTVLRGQKLGFSLIKDGVKVKEVHESIKEFFKESGYETGVVDGKNQGFIHSTGHGLGLEIHEPPRVGSTDDFLEAGNVITVEPGLYYEKLGGIRIEDVVVVEKDGYRNITRYPKKFKV